MSKKRKPQTAIEYAVDLYRIEPRWQKFCQTHISADMASTDSCWVWTGAFGNNNPSVMVGRVVVRVRGLFFRVYAKCDPARSTLLCQNTACVNPWHVGIPQRKRRKIKARSEIKPERLFPSVIAKQCRYGHPIYGPNLYVSTAYGQTHEHCRICHYSHLERLQGRHYGRRIRQIEQELERLAKKSHQWHPDFRGHEKENNQ